MRQPTFVHKYAYKERINKTELSVRSLCIVRARQLSLRFSSVRFSSIDVCTIDHPWAQRSSTDWNESPLKQA